MNVMGLKAFPYYLGTLITDYLFYSITIVFFYFLTILVEVPFLENHLNKITIILLVFG